MRDGTPCLDYLCRVRGDSEGAPDGDAAFMGLTS